MKGKDKKTQFTLPKNIYYQDLMHQRAVVRKMGNVKKKPTSMFFLTRYKANVKGSIGKKCENIYFLCLQIHKAFYHRY